MDSEIANPHGHNYEEDPHNGLHSSEIFTSFKGEDEHQHEKKSVLKKVRVKAKKIKETLTKHGHGHGHELGHDEHGHDHDFDEKDDEDEEMIEDPEPHGAPMYESAAIRSGVPGQEENIGQTRVKFGRSTVMEKDPLAATKGTDPVRNSVPGQEENRGQPRGNLGRSTVMEEDPHAPVNTPVSFSPGINQTRATDLTRDLNHAQEERQYGGNLGGSAVLEEDPHAPKGTREAYSPANYQPKVTDHTGDGGEEAGITPILRSFGKMRVYDEPEQKTEHYLPTGSHDQFSPELAPPRKITNFSENPQPVDDQRYDNKTETPPNQSSYTEKISSATSAITDKAISTKNIVTPKPGYGGKDDNAAPDMHEGGDKVKSSQVGEYGRRIAATLTEKLAPVYDKVAETGSTVMSKMPGTGTGIGIGIDGRTGTETEGGFKGPDKGVSMKGFLAEKLRPGDEDRALCEVISDALGKRKEENEAEKASRPVSEVISDALHKRKEEAEGDKVSRPMGKVVESEEVAKRLGTGDENYGERVDCGNVRVDSGNVSPGKGVVGRLKGVVGSWLGKGGDWSQTSQASQASLGSSYGVEGLSGSASGEVGHGRDAVGERRFQESSN